MSADVKPGYKQTEIGVIPDDWSVCELGDLAPYVTSGSRGWAEYYSDRGDLFVRITNLSRSTIYIDQADLKFVQIPDGDSDGQRTALIDGDLLISITADIGIIGYVDSSLSKPAYINQHIALVRFKDPEVDSKYLSYFLAGEVTQRLFQRSTDQGAKAGMNLAGIRSIKAVLPPIAEQRAISAALSEMDTLLSSLDQLITKKRNLQQASMQQLLTGQTRISGFSGDWIPTTLGEVATFLSGGTPSRSNGAYWNGEIPWISASSLRCSEIWRSENNVTEEAVAAGSKIAPIGSTLLLVRGSALHKEILCGLVTNRVCFNQDVKALLPHSMLFPRFLTVLIRGRSGDLLKLVSSAGNTAGVLDTKLLKAFEFSLPGLPEQTAITNVLTDMDAELAALEDRRDKARLLKQGMMQELLTGRIRLA